MKKAKLTTPPRSKAKSFKTFILAAIVVAAAAKGKIPLETALLKLSNIFGENPSRL